MRCEFYEETDEFEFSRDELAAAVEIGEPSEIACPAAMLLAHSFWCALFEYDLDCIEATCSGFYVPQAVEVRGG